MEYRIYFENGCLNMFCESKGKFPSNEKVDFIAIVQLKALSKDQL